MMLLGTEELVDLFEQLSAGTLVFIEHDNIHAVFFASIAALRPAGPAPMTINSCRFILSVLLLWLYAVLRLDLHALLQRSDTSPHIGNAVDDHDTVGTSANGTKMPLACAASLCSGVP